ncbi:MAG: ATP-binding cassette domain-containing protein [Burkholderiaceae bacterium]
MPWLTVRQNIAFAAQVTLARLRCGQRAGGEIRGHGGPEPGHRQSPASSGGMKQRVGIARAFSFSPKMLLLDEPFGALDALTRGTIQDELMAIVHETHQTVFMITHDVDEAILLADRILLMSNGQESAQGYKPGGLAEVVVNPLRIAPARSCTTWRGYYAPAQPHRRFPWWCRVP